MKAVIDVLFTLEQELDGWSEEGKANLEARKELAIKLFKDEFSKLMELNMGGISSVDIDMTLNRI